jgi:polysaccharide biosynthesis/export protein
MPQSCEPTCQPAAARLRLRASNPAARAMVICVSMVTALIGCRATSYTAARLPPHLEVPPAPATTGINLAQMVGRGGGGTSQIEYGDLVEITIASGLETQHVEPVSARVAQDGAVLVPLVGPVPIDGLEPIDAEQRIAAAAVERGVFRQPYVTLRIAERAVNRVTVIGAVAEPGVVELPRGSSDLISALAAAGGLADDASTEVDVLHHDQATFMAAQPGQTVAHGSNEIRLASHAGAASRATPIGFEPPPLAGGDSTSVAVPAVAEPVSLPRTTRIDLAQVDQRDSVNHELDDRDVVMVLPEEKRVIHVTGLVYKPNQFEISPDRDMHVLDAIAMAGGTKSPLADKVFVIRQLPDMQEPAVIRVSLSDAKRNGADNLRLAAGDLVSVEATAATLVFDTATNFFRVAIGLSGNVMTF